MHSRIISRDFLRSKVLGKMIVLRTIRDKKGKFGRYLAIIILNFILAKLLNTFHDLFLKPAEGFF